MSERRYKWGDPVWVDLPISGKCKGIVEFQDDCGIQVNCLKDDGMTFTTTVAKYQAESRDEGDSKPAADHIVDASKMVEPTPKFKVGDPVIYTGSNVGMVGETGKIDFIESTKFFVKFDNRSEPLPVHADALVLDQRCDTPSLPAADRFAAPGKVIEPSAIKLDSIVEINNPDSPLDGAVVKVVAKTYSGDSCQVLCLDGHTRVVKAEECVPSPGITNKAWEEAFEHDSKIKPAIPEETTFDPVAKARHYNLHPSGVECITIAKHMNFCLGSVLKYIWRVDDKEVPIQDLRKAIQFLEYEIERRLELETGNA